MDVTYQAENYRPDLVRARYVRRSGDAFRWCEVGDDRRHDLRQGTIDPSELDFATRREANALASHVYGWVKF